jgi:hypothetical protein
LGVFGSEAYCSVLMQVWSRRKHPEWANIDPDDAAGAVPCLVELLRNPDRSTREDAAFWLGWLGPRAKASVPYLIQLRLDEEEVGHAPTPVLPALVSIIGVGRNLEEPAARRYSAYWSKREWVNWWNDQNPDDWGF